MISQRWSVGDESDCADNEEDACPAVGAEMLMQPEPAEQRNDDVAERRCRHHEGEVGPAERGHVACEESNEKQNAKIDEWIEERMPQQAQVMQVYSAYLPHAAREKGIAEWRGERNSK